MGAFFSFELSINEPQGGALYLHNKVECGLIEKGRCPNHWNIIFFQSLKVKKY